MVEIALANLNSFAPMAEQAVVSPKETIFVLTSSQLQDIIVEATKSLNSKIDALEGRIAQLEGDRARFEDLDKDLATLSENQLIQLRLINDLRKDREPQPLQKDRAEILRALLVANNGKMLATDARKKMHLSRNRFSELLAKVKDDIEVKPYHLNKSCKVLVLK